MPEIERIGDEPDEPHRGERQRLRAQLRCVLAGVVEQGRAETGWQRRQPRERHVLAIEQHAAGNKREPKETKRSSQNA